jgi:molybdenum cofactor cytidylyltransferase
MPLPSQSPSPALAGIVLAAGESRRFGRPKQLADWNGKALLGHAIEAVLAVCGSAVLVVTGAAAERVSHCAAGYPVQVVHNPDWRRGMASSLRAGLSALDNAGASAVLILACDQPLVDAAWLASLVRLWQTEPARPVAARYNGVLGIPAIFPQALVPELKALRGDQGARGLLNEQLDPLAVDMPVAAIDIDTEAELAQLGSSVLVVTGKPDVPERNR